jgi:hypothetical protein
MVRLGLMKSRGLFFPPIDLRRFQSFARASRDGRPHPTVVSATVTGPMLLSLAWYRPL